MQTVLTIRHFERFENVVERLNKKAKKLGFPEIGVKLLETRFLKLRNPSDPYELWGFENFITLEERDYEITSEEIVLDGEWKLIAAYNLKENLVLTVPGEVVPNEYLKPTNKCDHCHVDRPRNDTFLIQSGETGEYKIIGRTCLGEFLGINPAEALQRADWFVALGNDFADEPNFSPVTLGNDLTWFMAFVIKSVRKDGFVSKKFASENGKAPTAEIADYESNLTSSQMKDRQVDYPSKSDFETAKETIEWMKNINPTNDYLSNLKSIANNGFVTHKSYGYAASAFSAMMKETETVKKEKKVSHYLGKVGDKINVTATLVFTASFEAQFGRVFTTNFIHKFVDDNGNVIVWKTQTELEPNRQYKIEGKIKELGEYRNELQTIITRPKVETV